MSFHSEVKQDFILDRIVFEGARDLTFVECGAYDGVTNSNSLFFELVRGWKGFCIEADPSSFAALQKNRARNSTNVHAALGDTDGVTEFTQVSGYAQQISSISGSADTDRIKSEVEAHGGTVSTIRVPLRRFDSIVATPHVHLFSLDVEGGEVPALLGMNWQKTLVHVLMVESKRGEQEHEIRKTLAGEFIWCGRHHADLYFINRRSPYKRRSLLLTWHLATLAYPADLVGRAKTVLKTLYLGHFTKA